MSDDTTTLHSPDVATPEHEPTVAPPGGAGEPRPPAPPVPPGATVTPPAGSEAPTSPPGAPPSVPGWTPPTPPTPPAPPMPPPGAAPVSPPVPPSPPGRGRRAAVAVGAVALMLLSATGGALVALQLDDGGSDSTRTVVSSLDTSSANRRSSTPPDEPLSEAAAAVLPSVVSIQFESNNAQGSGSGIIISEDGQILTNNHVVAEVADGGDLSVTFSDGKQADAEIVGRDPATDLAVIQAQDVSGLTPATLGSSADLHVGDTVLAIGSPLGLDGSVSAGIVSALNRSIQLGGESNSPFGGQSSAVPAVIDAIQTDAAINPGNSGGALVDTDGKVVGINTAIASLAQGTGGEGGNIGVGFAIPIDSAKDIAAQLVQDGKVTHAYLGVQIADADTGTGALVGGVVDGQPAAQAGLAEGDVITKVGDTDITNATDLTAAIRTFKPGDKVTVTYTRDGEEHTADVTLAELPS